MMVHEIVEGTLPAPAVVGKYGSTRKVIFLDLTRGFLVNKLVVLCLRMGILAGIEPSGIMSFYGGPVLLW